MALARVSWFALLALVTCAGATAADRIDTPECKVSRAQLDIAMAATGAEAAKKLRDARERTAQACFGVPSDSAIGPRTLPTGPAFVRPGTATAAPALKARPSPSLASPSLNLRNSSAVNLCDDTGCWDSNGQRLNRIGPGPLLAGPRGPCTVEAGVANCP